MCQKFCFVELGHTWKISLVCLIQGSFIHNIGIVENALIAYELVHYMHTKKGKYDFLMNKIDFERAYDNDHLNSLKLTLCKFGFLLSFL